MSRIVPGGFWGRILALIEKRRLRRSFKIPFIARTGRDSYNYYQDGRSVQIHVEMMSGHLPRRIYRQDLKWSDSEVPLAPVKNDEVIAKLCEHFDACNIKWEFYFSAPHGARTIESNNGAVLLFTKSERPVPHQPCQMKTPSGLSLIGFASQEIGTYYMRRYPNYSAKEYFVSVKEYFSGAPELAKTRIKIVYFRNESDVDMHFRDRAAFPYQDFELTAEQIEETG